jgi:carbonic anhydrase
MNNLDYSERWVYKGSNTHPPCNKYVYWNILKTVYPISQRNLDLISAQLQNAGIDATGENGNWREIQ